MQPADDSLTLRLSPRALDYIAQVLMTRPWSEANPLLVDIRAQVDAQQLQPPLPVVGGTED